ncbi:MAG: methyltransferase [Luminiphilus sp.]|nr:methyltransferase [Luminiphilus sp.]
MNLIKLTITLLALTASSLASADLNWDAALTGAHRSEGNAARNDARHPRETLQFFGLASGMTVMEVAPGGGWYTEVLAVLMHNQGTYLAAHSTPNGGAYARRSLGGFLRKLGENNDIYGDVVVTELQPPLALEPAEAGTVDLAVAFRNVHSWMRADQVETYFASIFDALKPGGVFGVVQHRAKPGTSLETMRKSAYVTEEQVIEYAQLAGFELDARSEINANPRDTKDYPGGVWTLPPSLSGDEKNREKYLAIGESDRMTLRFRKPSP